MEPALLDAEPVTNVTDRSEPTDVELMARLGHGDESAFAELYDRHRSAAYGLALRVLRSRTLAEDAVQEAFVGIWRSSSGYRADLASPRAWILVHVHRRAVDLVRREARWCAQTHEQLDLTTESAAHLVELDQERRSVQRALGRLPEQSRRLLELAYYGGLTQSQLAAALELPLGTVKSRTHSALARLRELLAEEISVGAPAPS